MSDNEAVTPGKAANTTWTDKERLVYLIHLIEKNGFKLDHKGASRPNGRSEIACTRMVDRLKTHYKDELEALMSDQPFDNGTAAKTPRKRAPAKLKATNGAGTAEGDGDGEVPKTPKTPKTPKRKGKTDADGEASPTPKKRGKRAGKIQSSEDVTEEDMKDEAHEENKNEAKGEDTEMAEI